MDRSLIGGPLDVGRHGWRRYFIVGVCVCVCVVGWCGCTSGGDFEKVKSIKVNIKFYQI
jgi:hypothetical protein